jgi:hypothetical protein
VAAWEQETTRDRIFPRGGSSRGGYGAEFGAVLHEHQSAVLGNGDFKSLVWQIRPKMFGDQRKKVVVDYCVESGLSTLSRKDEG